MRPDVGLVVEHVAALDTEGRTLRLKKGEPFPWQDKRLIRALGPALGVPDADSLPWSELPYVRTRALRPDPVTGVLREVAA